MNVPAAQTIEGAVDAMKRIPAWVAADQLKELASAIGAPSAASLAIEFPISAEFATGYSLGLAVARQMLAGSVALSMKGIDPKTLL